MPVRISGHGEEGLHDGHDAITPVQTIMNPADGMVPMPSLPSHPIAIEGNQVDVVTYPKSQGNMLGGGGAGFAEHTIQPGEDRESRLRSIEDQALQNNRTLPEVENFTKARAARQNAASPLGANGSITTPKPKRGGATASK